MLRLTICPASALENGPWTWQSSQFYSESTLGYNPYYRFCDYIEVNSWRLLRRLPYVDN